MSAPIELGYVPHLFQQQVHQEMKRFSVLVCHRRWGKTVCAVNSLIDAAIKSPKNFEHPGRFAYIAPLRTQAKGVAWDYFKAFSRSVPGVKVNESELLISFAHNGATIRLYGADNPDAMRGIYLDGCVMDEVADMKPDVWDAVIRPALSDRLGWCLFIGTPKGMNRFYQLYVDALANPDWYARLFSVSETLEKLCEDERHPWRDGAEIEASKAEMSESKFRQEWYCDFAASKDNVLIPLDLVEPANGKHLNKEDYMMMPKVLGVDVARFGDDRSCIVYRQGLAVLEMLTFKNIDNMSLVGQVGLMIQKYEPDAIFIDGGRGEGVIDRLRELGNSPIEVQFGSRSLYPHKYVNKRAEMWDKMKEWFMSGGAIPPNQELVASLVALEYSYDSSSRIQLEKKEKMKERVGFSPDPADALALTFAFPVNAKPANGWELRSLLDRTPVYANNEYDPLR